MASTPEQIRIRYHRPPDRETVYVQRLVHRAPDAVVTFLEHTPLSSPFEADGHVLLEPDAPVVWFTFRDAHHDIGRFHLADGSFTGIYANMLTPVVGIDGVDWSTTDLFLDLWLAPGQPPRILDADELDAAHRAGVVADALAEQARTEAERLLAAAKEGSWPPPIVAEWTLERVFDAFGGTGPSR